MVIQIGTDDAARLVTAFPAEFFFVPPVEVVAVELGRAHGAHLNIIALEGMTKADLYPLPALQRTWFDRRRRLEVAGRQIWVAAPEAVILNKLLFYRDGGGDKHLRDVRAMMMALGDSLDRTWLIQEARRIGVILPEV